MKVALTGATGLIGTRLIELLSHDLEFLPFSSKDIDITNKDSVRTALSAHTYDIMVHLAGYTNVNGAEQERDKAYAINVTGTKNLHEVVNAQHKPFVYISTDYVFDGKAPPFYEDTPAHPIGYYGQTKYEGECAVKDNAMIIRPSFPYRREFDKKKDFMRTIKTLLTEGTQLKMVTDSLITPTFIDDFAYALRYLVHHFTPEVFHIVGSSSMSPHDAGIMIAKAFHLDESLIQPTTYAEYFRGKAAPPQYSQIKSNKNTFCSMKSFEEGLATIAKELNM